MGGTPYAHLLPEGDARRNFLDDERILEAVRNRFASHKAGDERRTLANTAASQPFCFNLFAPLAGNLRLASHVFSELLGREVKIVHIAIEFTPNAVTGPSGFDRSIDESLADQAGSAGTDADLAIFLVTEGGRREVLLIETKLIESEFSVCGSYKEKPACKERCRGPAFYVAMIESRAGDAHGRPFCGYLRYANWKLTQTSGAFDISTIRSFDACPFQLSGQQLWRNVLLAENVCRARGLDDYAFWVISPRDNVELWRQNGCDVEREFRRTLTPVGNDRFQRVALEDVIDILRRSIQAPDESSWLQSFTEKYLPRT